MFQLGNQYGKKSKRGYSIDKAMKDRIKSLANGLIDSIDISELTTNQRIALLKAVIPYLLPKDSNVEEQSEYEDHFAPPAVIVFHDTEEYKAYKELSNSEGL